MPEVTLLCKKDQKTVVVPAEFVECSEVIKQILEDVSQENIGHFPVSIDSSLAESLVRMNRLLPAYEPDPPIYVPGTEELPVPTPPKPAPISCPEAEVMCDAMFADKKLFDFINAASLLDIKNVIKFTVQKLARMMEDKSLHEIADMFEIGDELTPEERAESRAKVDWAIDPRKEHLYVW